jgi:hypothetical protein
MTTALASATGGLARADRSAVLAAAREIRQNARDLERDWTRRLRAAGTVLPPRDGLAESAFLAPGGGYRLPLGQLAELGDAAWAFFSLRIAPDGWAYLRGYGYYAADAAMYLPDRVPSAGTRWDIITSRWPFYRDLTAPMAAEAAVPPVPWGRWLAWLSFLEAIVNDLCAAAWCASSLGDGEASAMVMAGIAGVCELLAEAGWHWWNEPGRARQATWAARLSAVAGDPELAGMLAGLGGRLRAERAPSWAVRAIREGDITWQAAAAFETVWPAVRAAHPASRFLLVSEVFGAMAAGPLWAAMMPDADRDVTALATTRMSVHEQEMGRVPATAWRTTAIPAAGRVVVHLDDSVFTGRTYAALRDALTGTPEAVYLAALTLDVGTPVNHPEEVTSLGRTVAGHMGYITTLARTPSGRLPSAASLWARRKRIAEDPAARVAGGSDRLLATLWHRYAEDIHA